jgi:DNA-binding NarL/FixJ family response regulator
MIRVYLATVMLTERSALRIMLLDMNMEIAGEADNWLTAFAGTSSSRADILIVDWELLPVPSSTALNELRAICANALIVVIISHLGFRQQAALSAGADFFISKSDMPERVSSQLLAAAAKIHI